jgi:hypothetical protein
MKLLKIYVGVIESDGLGSQGSRDHSYHSTYSAALNAVKGASSWGSDGTVREALAVRDDTVPGETYLVSKTIDLDGEEEKAKKALQEQALAKLSPEEREALGV